MSSTLNTQLVNELVSDMTSFAHFMYKPAGFKVTRRLAPPVDTLQFYIDRFNSLNGDFSSSVSVALSSLNNSVAEADGKVAYIETTVQDAINNTAIEGGVLADTFVVVDATLNQRQINRGFESVDDMLSIANPNDGLRVYVKSYHAGRGVGGGYFIYDSSRASENDGGLIINGWVKDAAALVSVKDFGAVGDGKVDDTAAIQAAFDGGGLQPIFFPAGLYKVTSQGEACLTLRKNRNIYGATRSSTIRADAAGADTSMLRIAIADNQGLLDVRGWELRNLRTFFNGGGKHGLHIEGGMPILNSIIAGCNIGSGANLEGDGIYVNRNLAHSTIESCGFSSAYLMCGDANLINQCLTYGRRPAVTFDCHPGVRNNTVSNCTLVNRDGQVVIINADNTRIINNQMELAQIYSPTSNQSEFGAMVTVHGVDRPVYNTIIEDNNFGGGTNVGRSIYLDNARRTVVDKNNFIAVNTADIELSSNSSYNFIGHKNNVTGSNSNPRLGGLNKLKIVDNGMSNYGIVKTTAGVGGWGRVEYIKGEDSTVAFTQPIDGTATTTGTKIATIERGFRPAPKNSNIRKNLLPDTSGLSWSISSVTKTPVDTTINPHTSGALRLAATAGVYPHALYTTTVSSVGTTPHTLSMYIKRATSTSVTGVYIELSVRDKANSFARINVNTSTLQATISPNSNFYTGTSAQVIDAGNGWYRVVATFSLVEAGSVTVLVTPNNNLTNVNQAYEGTADTTILMYGMQLELGSTATGYQWVMADASLLDMEHTINILAITDAGVGYVTLDSLGNLKVGQLPSANSVSISSYQSTANGS